MESFSWTFRAGFRVTQHGVIRPESPAVMFTREDQCSHSSRRPTLTKAALVFRGVAGL